MKALHALPTPDSYVWPRGPELKNVQLHDGHLQIGWSDGSRCHLHAMWLRDNCACDDCTHPATREQKIDLLDIDDDIAALEAEIDASGGLRVHWNQDAHRSLYDPGWLYAHSHQQMDVLEERQLWTAAELREIYGRTRRPT